MPVQLLAANSSPIGALISQIVFCLQFNLRKNMHIHFKRIISAALVILTALASTAYAGDRVAFDSGSLLPNRIVIKNGSTLNFQGRLYTSGNRGVPNATIVLHVDGVNRGSTKTDANGRFNISLRYLHNRPIPLNGANVVWYVDYVAGGKPIATTKNVHIKQFGVVR
jgi:hypothetical protein